MKKFIAVLLTVILILGTIGSSFGAFSASEQYPVVYLEGTGDTLYSSDNPNDHGTEIFPTGADLGAILKEAIMPCLQELSVGLVTKDYEKYCQEFYNAFAPVFEKLILDKNGEVSDGSGDGRKPATEPLSTKNYGGSLSGYRYCYDWRLSPLDNMEELKIYIDRVKEITKAEKVNLVSRCLGCNMVCAYLTKYEQHVIESVDSVVLYVPSVSGIKLVGALFTGEIDLKDENIDRFADYYLGNGELIEDEVISSLITSFISLINEAKALGVGVAALQYIIDEVKAELIPMLLLASYGTFPSYWAMVDTPNFEKARDFVFAGKEDEYAGLISKINEYYYDVQLPLEDTLKALEKKGIKFSVIAKYNTPNFPIYAEADEQSDLFTGVYEQSFGATSAPLDKTLSEKYISSLSTDKYLSPDKKIDASSCLFPDTTWFIKDIVHDDFPGSINDLMVEFMNSKGTMNVFNNEKYPQYLKFNEADESITPVEGLDDEEPAFGSIKRKILVFIEFFKNLFIFLKNLISEKLA